MNDLLRMKEHNAAGDVKKLSGVVSPRLSAFVKHIQLLLGRNSYERKGNLGRFHFCNMA